MEFHTSGLTQAPKAKNDSFRLIIALIIGISQQFT